MLDFDALKNSRISASRHDVHLYADYAELLCLAHPDSLLTRSAFLAFLEKREFFSSTPGESVDQDSPLDLSWDEQEGEDYLNESPEIDDSASDLYVLVELSDIKTKQIQNPIDRDSNRESFVNDIFEHLRCRWLLFTETAYPFISDEEAESIHLKSTLGLKQKMYVFMLLCSNLNLFRSAQSTLTTTFEIVSASVFRKLVPNGSEVHVFGKGGAASPLFTGNKKTKLAKLAKYLNTELFADSNFPANDNGDAGLDLVSWLSPGDTCNGMLIFFGQCGCGKTWGIKQDEVAPIKWGQYFLLKQMNVQVAFVPYHLRNSSGGWHEPQEVRCLMIDRLRFFHYLEDKEIKAHAPALATLENLLKSKIVFG